MQRAALLLGGRGRRLSTAAAAAAGDELGALPLAFPAVTIWGSNTCVGKTLFSAGLAAACRRAGVSWPTPSQLRACRPLRMHGWARCEPCSAGARGAPSSPPAATQPYYRPHPPCVSHLYATPPPQLSVLYLKPVQTGFPQDSDARLVAAAAGLPVEAGPHAAHLAASSSSGSSLVSSSASTSASGGSGDSNLAKTLYAWSQPVSPHLAVEHEGRPVGDAQVAAHVAAELRAFAAAPAAAAGRVAIVETAGGVASPGPSGSLQVRGGCCQLRGHSPAAGQISALHAMLLPFCQPAHLPAHLPPRSATCCARCACPACWWATAAWAASPPRCQLTKASPCGATRCL